MFEALQKTIPELEKIQSVLPLANDLETLWEALRRLLAAHAPSGGAWLPGAIVDEIASLAGMLGLGDRWIPRLGSTGNAALWLGVDKPEADVVVVSHMDRPSFRVRDTGAGALYPICANRFPDGQYIVGAKALRFANGQIVVGARGKIVSERGEGRDSLRFAVESGQLSWQDTITMDVDPILVDGMVTGTGLDNCFGVLTMLGTAAALRSVEDMLRQKNRRCVLVFTDLEEGIPEAFFGHGAARLRFAIPQPTMGVIVADAQTVSPGGPLVIGGGAGYGTVSAWSRGSIVPPNYIALAVDLGAALNKLRPNTVQMNTGYLSRSDDMVLGRWTQILGMIGAPMADAHTGHESGRLQDVQSAMWWLSYFTAAALALDDSLAQQYGLVVKM